MYSEKALEQKLRRELKKLGYSLHKSRKAVGPDNYGEYMVVNISGNYAIGGSWRYNLSLEDIAELLEEE